MKTTRVRFYGMFRKYFSGVAELRLELPAGVPVRELRVSLDEQIRKALPACDPALLSESALATEKEILQESAIWNGEGELSVLPPVCGG